jgi:eukaryotic-like serine/threonine-protein kinase
LLELTRDLLVRAKHDESHPIPVIFHLSSWSSSDHSLAEWLVKELYTMYDIARDVGKAWVNSNNILLLLDGLDEMDPAYRAGCVEAINNHQSQHHQASTVVCCRSVEYQDLTQQVHRLPYKTLVAQPLTEQQVDAYLASAGERLASVQKVLRADPALRKIVTTPLMLSVLILAYHEESNKEQTAGDSSEARPEEDASEVLRRVFKHYVKRMFERRGANSKHNPDITKHRLSWLARQMLKHKQSIFYIERMQPNWLPENHAPQRHSRLAAGLIFAFLGALLIGPFSGYLIFQSSELQSSFALALVLILLFGCISGLLFGLLNGLLYTRETGGQEHDGKWSLRRLGTHIFRGVFNGLLVGLLVGFPAGLFLSHLRGGGDELSSGIVQSIFFWLFGSAVFALIDGLLGIQVTEIQHAETFDWLKEKMTSNLLKYLFFGLLASLLFALLVGLISLLYLWRVYSPTNLLGALPAALANSRSALLATPLLILISGLLGGLTGGLTGKKMDDDNLTTPNVGIRRSALHGLLVGVATGLIGFLFGGAYGFLFAVTHIPLPILPTSLIFGLILGLLTGLISGMRSGGNAFFEHLALRWVLSKNNSLPWNYMHFLNYAVERILLIKVGGGYIFIHRLLLDYFADLETPP